MGNTFAICGHAAVWARFRREPDSILRLFFDEPMSRRLGALSGAMAGARRPYRMMDDAELAKVSGTKHHGGVVAIVPDEPVPEVSGMERKRWAKYRTPILLLDRVGNAHNLGALARTAAFFGVEHIVVPDHPSAALPSDSAYRVAEGGLEWVKVWRVKDLPAFIGELRAGGFQVAGTAVRGATALGPWLDARATAAEATGEAPPLALVLGNEEQGIGPQTAAACSDLLLIPGSERMESLNVAAAGAVLMFALWGEQKRRRKKA